MSSTPMDPREVRQAEDSVPVSDADAPGYSRHRFLARGSEGLRYRLGVVSRTVAAIVGGYALAALAATAVAIYYPSTRAEAAIFGMMASFAVYTCAVMWVFAVRTALKAWLGLILPSIPLAIAVAAHLYLRSAS